MGGLKELQSHRLHRGLAKQDVAGFIRDILSLAGVAPFHSFSEIAQSIGMF